MEVLLYIEKGPFATSGDPVGENVKFCWKGPAEDKIGSSFISKVSSARGI